MKKAYVLPLVSLVIPLTASAQTLQSLLTKTTAFIGSAVLPTLIALAFVIFLFNTVRYLMLADNEDKRKTARSFAIYSVIALVIMLCIWGIINFITSDLGLKRSEPVCPDYMSNCSNGGSTGGGNTSAGTQNVPFTNPNSSQSSQDPFTGGLPSSSQSQEHILPIDSSERTTLEPSNPVDRSGE